jgi:hypothetical protein
MQDNTHQRSVSAGPYQRNSGSTGCNSFLYLGGVGYKYAFWYRLLQLRNGRYLSNSRLAMLPPPPPGKQGLVPSGYKTVGPRASLRVLKKINLSSLLGRGSISIGSTHSSVVTPKITLDRLTGSSSYTNGKISNQITRQFFQPIVSGNKRR